MWIGGTIRARRQCDVWRVYKESKPRPDFTGTDDFQVFLTLRGDVQDVRFLRFLEQVGRETLQSFTTEDLLVLDTLRHQESSRKI